MAIMRTDAAVAVLLALAAPAAAQERPVFPPTHDVAVTYRVTLAQPNTPPELVMRYSAAKDRFRVEGGLPGARVSGTNLTGYVLVDHKSGRASLVIEQLGVMMDAPPRAGLDQAFLLENGRRFVRQGADTVAGLRCTVWTVEGDTASGTACVTAEGVVLRAGGHDRKGRAGSIEATQVEVGPQAEALFFPPANVHRLDLAAGPGGPAAAALLDRLRGRQP
jgi:hypothetical protein